MKAFTRALTLAALLLASAGSASAQSEDHVVPNVVANPAPPPEEAAREAGREAGGHEGAGHEGAGHGGAHEAHFDGKTFAFQLINLGILVAILVKFVGGALSTSFRQKHEQLKADLASATELRTAAEARLKQQEQRLANLEKEIADIRAGIQKEADDEKARLVAAAEERAQRLRDESVFLIEQQVKEAQIALRHEAANAVLTVAEAILKKNIAAADQQGLVTRFVDDVEKGRN